MLAKTTIGLFAVALAFGLAGASGEEPPTTSTEVVISIAEQRLVVLRDGMSVSKHRVSTSKFGLGDSFGSYRTPIGKLRVCEKIGDNFAPGAVIKHRHATGEILPVNAPGRDPIVTRVLWLDGLEERNKNAKSRGIYIHGTVEEAKIGSPVSYGCIRMRSREVTDVFDNVPLGSVVTIQAGRLGNYRHWTTSEPMVIAEKTPAGGAPAPEATPLPRVAVASSDKAVESREKRVSAQRTNGKVAVETSGFTGAGRSTLRPLLAASSQEKTEPKGRRESGGEGALKGSILFSDFQTHAEKASAIETLEKIRGPVLAPVGEAPRKEAGSREAGALPDASPPLPRVTFRTGTSASTIVERAP